MLKKHFILLLTLIFTFVSCGEDGSSDEEFNTTDYIYLVVELTKTEDTVNGTQNLFKINGKSEDDSKEVLNYVNAQLTKQDHPLTNITIFPDLEYFAFKIKAKDINEIVNTFKIKVTANEAGYITTPFEYLGFGHKNAWCSGIDVQKEADFPYIKLAYMILQYNYYEDYPEARGFEVEGFFFDKLTGNPDVQNGMGCAGGKGVVGR